VSFSHIYFTQKKQPFTSYLVISSLSLSLSLSPLPISNLCNYSPQFDPKKETPKISPEKFSTLFA
jgi:hypothetical protein